MKHHTHPGSISSAIWARSHKTGSFTLDGYSLSPRQVNQLVATVNCRLTPAQRDEVKGFFVFGEPPSQSTRLAFEEILQRLCQNQHVLAALLA